MYAYLAGRLASWLVDWLADWMAGWPVGRLAGWLAVGHLACHDGGGSRPMGFKFQGMCVPRVISP